MKLKPSLTYDEQVDHLINEHNLTISNKENAKKILATVNYYRLSGYGIGLTVDKERKKYLDGTSIEDLFKLYCFDSQFKNCLIHTIEQLEIQLRTQIAYLLATQYGPEGYMDINNFQSSSSKNIKNIHNSILQKLNLEIDRQKNVPFVKHHLTKYKGHFPIWVSVELLTFGNLSSLFSILKTEDKKKIAALYNTSPSYFNSWILSLVEVRNICAHYTRLYNLPLKQTPRLYGENKVYRHDINKIFPVLLVIKRMLNSNEQWESLFRDLKTTINKYLPVIRFDYMGFPSNWQEVLSGLPNSTKPENQYE